MSAAGGAPGDDGDGATVGGPFLAVRGPYGLKHVPGWGLGGGV